MARNPSSPSYMPNGEKRGFNQLHAHILYDLLNDTYVHCRIDPQPTEDEIGALDSFLNGYPRPEKLLVIGDRGYESYNAFATFKETGVDFLIRVKQNKGAMREVQKLPFEEFDRDISFTVSTTQTKFDKDNGHIFIQTRRDGQKNYSTKTKMRRWQFQSPYYMTLRVVRVRLSTGEFETLATSLPRSITAEEVKEMYHWRWKIETSFRSLKHNIGIERLHGRSDEYAIQEIFAALAISNMCSRILQPVTPVNKANNKLQYAINRKMAVVLCRKYFAGKIDTDGELLKKIRKHSEAVRPDRRNARNIRQKTFAWFTYRIPT